MTKDQKDEHTLQKCNACLKSHKELQMAFPQGPYHDVQLISINTKALNTIGKKEATRMVLHEMNSTFSETFKTSFSESLVKCGEPGLQRKVSQGEKKGT